MKNMVVTITVSGIVVLLILVAAVVFQKVNMVDSIKSADKVLNKERHTIENNIAKDIEKKQTTPTAEQPTATTPADAVPTAEQPTATTPADAVPTAEQPTATTPADAVPTAEQPTAVQLPVMPEPAATTTPPAQ